MTGVTVYSKDNCSWCTKAIQLLTDRGVPFKVLKLGVDYTREDFIMGGIPLSTPQIFVNDKHIGGYSELLEYLENTSTGESYD